MSQLTDIIAGIFVFVVVEACGSKAALDSYGAGPDEPLVDLVAVHRGHQLITSVVVDFGAVTADDVVLRVDFWQTACVALNLLRRALSYRGI